MNSHFDLIVIGAGPAGYKSALIAARTGYNVALIEKNSESENNFLPDVYAKDILTPIAAALKQSQDVAFAKKSKTSTPDFKAAITFAKKRLKKANHQLKQQCEHAGITLINGNASFVNKNTVVINVDKSKSVEAPKLHGDRIVIASGTQAQQHATLSTDTPGIVHSSQFLHNLTTLPSRVLCINGNQLNVELAFIFQQFGANVTIIDENRRLLNKTSFSQTACRSLETALNDNSIIIKTNTRALAEISTETSINVLFDDGTADGFDLVLLDNEPSANVESLHLSNADITLQSDGFIATNDNLRTSTEGIYAVGSIQNVTTLIDDAFEEASLVVANAMSGKNKIKAKVSPVFVKSIISMSAIGMTYEQAKVSGYDAEQVHIDLKEYTLPLSHNDSESYVDVIFDKTNFHLLGGSIVGDLSRELAINLQVACKTGSSQDFFNALQYTYPNLKDSLNQAMLSEQFLKQSENELSKPKLHSNSL